MEMYQDRVVRRGVLAFLSNRRPSQGGYKQIRVGLCKLIMSHLSSTSNLLLSIPVVVNTDSQATERLEEQSNVG